MGASPSASRLPTPAEVRALRALQASLSTPVDVDAANDWESKPWRLLERLWGAMLPDAFEHEGRGWRTLGFQREDPTTDIRGGGELSLENLVYFAESYNESSRGMLARRAVRRQRGEFANFPWAAAGVNVTKMVCELFLLVERSGATSQAFETTPAPFWHLAATKSGLHEVFCLAFLLVDALWDVRGASYLEFNAILAETKDVMSRVLQAGPETLQAACALSMQLVPGVVLDSAFVYGISSAPSPSPAPSPAPSAPPAAPSAPVASPAETMLRRQQELDLLTSDADLAEIMACNAEWAAAVDQQPSAALPPPMHSRQASDGHVRLVDELDFFAQFDPFPASSRCGVVCA